MPLRLAALAVVATLVQELFASRTNILQQTRQQTVSVDESFDDAVLAERESHWMADAGRLAQGFSNGRAAKKRKPRRKKFKCPKLPEERKLLKCERRGKRKRRPNLANGVYLTGKWGNWRLRTDARLRPMQGAPEGWVRLWRCVNLTSQTFSFQVVAPSQNWTWRLYPRDAKPQLGTHISKQGMLQEGERDVVVGVGNMKRGHGLNFHVADGEQKCQPIAVTIYVEVPVVPGPDGKVLLNPSRKAELRPTVWFTREQCKGCVRLGDGYDFSRGEMNMLLKRRKKRRKAGGRRSTTTSGEPSTTEVGLEDTGSETPDIEDDEDVEHTDVVDSDADDEDVEDSDIEDAEDSDVEEVEGSDVEDHAVIDDMSDVVGDAAPVPVSEADVAIAEDETVPDDA